MNTILDAIKANPVDYGKILSDASYIQRYKDSGYTFHVIIPVRGRVEFLAPLIDSLEYTTDYIPAAITVVEHSGMIQHANTCLKKKVNYIWIQDHGPFNKCLAFNVGAILGSKAHYLVCHDLDMLVQDLFFRHLFDNIKNKICKAIQSFNKRRVIYCDYNLTRLLIENLDLVETLFEGHEGTFTAPGLAPGGSITLSRDLFFDVGGYDPELFWGYAPEDGFIWDKISLTDRIGSCDDPVVEVFHMHHEPTMNSNPDFPKMRDLALRFNALSNEEKRVVVEYKRSLISQYK
jgi:hypothetical protein